MLILAGLFALQRPAAAQEMQVLDEVVAVVEGDIILRSEVDNLLFSLLQQQRMSYSEELWYEVLDRLIDQKVLLAHARRDTTLIISEDQVNQSLDEWVNSLVAQVGGQAQLEEMTGKSVPQFMDDNRAQLREQLLVDEFRRRKMQKIRITPSEVRAWFEGLPADSLPIVPEMVRVAHIVRFPQPDPAAREEALEIATALRDSVLAGSELENLARRFSDDPGSASRGGRIEDVNIGDLVPEFGAVAASMQPGQISHVFETTFGYHFMRLNNRTGDMIDFNHILIRIDQSNLDPTQAIETLTMVRDSITTYRIPFEHLARRHSEDPQTANNGGNVIAPNGERDIPLSALGSDWQRTLDTLELGQVSQPAAVTVMDGRQVWHIVLLRSRTPEHRMSLQTDYTRIEQAALQEKRAREIENWVDQLREDVYISLLRVDESQLTSARAPR